MFQDPGTLFQDPGAMFQDPGTLFQDPRTSFLDPGTMFQDPAIFFLAHWAMTSMAQCPTTKRKIIQAQTAPLFPAISF